MTQDRAREGDWNRTEWEGDGPGSTATTATTTGPAAPTADPATGDRWTKTEVVGEGQGSAGPSDPDAMPEGETGLSGDRHAPSEQHFARGQASDERHA